jgi:nucleoid-associated protein YgaU
MTIADSRKKLDDGARELITAFGNLIPTKTVVVQNSDTLWKLATRELGNGNLWPEVFFMNLDVIKANQAAHPGTAGVFSKDFSGEFGATQAAISTIYAGQKLLVMMV